MKAFKHIYTGRYLASITRKHKEIETTKMIDDAITFDLTLRGTQANYCRFIKAHEKELRQFIEIEI